MTRSNRRSTVDHSPYATVVTCPNCSTWRELTDNQSHAWYLLARHLKLTHDDMHASKTARRNYHRHLE